MPTAVLVGTLLLCLLLLLLTVGEALPARRPDAPCRVFTVLVLCKDETITHLKLRIAELDWMEETSVGTVILLCQGCDRTVADYCNQLCVRRREFQTCTPERLPEVIRSLSEEDQETR